MRRWQMYGRTLAAVLAPFKVGTANWFMALMTRRIDRILFAAAKSDHVHHTTHARLEALLAGIAHEAADRATIAGAEIKLMALSALRATREAEMARADEPLPCIVGTPLPGEQMAGRTFDGRETAAIFTGDLPAAGRAGAAKRPPIASARDVNVIRFRPPRIAPADGSGTQRRRGRIFASTAHWISWSEIVSHDANAINPGRRGVHHWTTCASPINAERHRAGDGRGRRRLRCPPFRCRPAGGATFRLGRAVLLGGCGAEQPGAEPVVCPLRVRGARAPGLGGLDRHGALLGLMALAAVVIVGREALGFWRLARLGRAEAGCSARPARAGSAGERKAVRRHRRPAGGRPELRWPLARLREHQAGVRDPGDLFRLTDRDLLAPLDNDARRLVTRAAKRVSVATAMSPAALFAVLWVLVENVRLIRGLATLYGGRPGLLGTAQLGRMVLTHLVATGGVALTDDLLGQFLGQDLLRRLSRRLGEGMFNGALTARIGTAAIEVTRPLPFIEARPVRARDFLLELTRRREEVAAPSHAPEMANGAPEVRSAGQRRLSSGTG